MSDQGHSNSVRVSQDFSERCSNARGSLSRDTLKVLNVLGWLVASAVVYCKLKCHSASRSQLIVGTVLERFTVFSTK